MKKLCYYKYLALLFLLLAGFVTSSCKKSVNGPEKNEMIPSEDVLPGSRNYKWTVDTIKIHISDVFHLNNIWGSSPNDVWAVGGADISRIEIWHYDGIQWRTDSLYRTLSSVIAIYGFGPNDVWIGDTDGNIWHYINSWIKSTRIVPQKNSLRFVSVGLGGAASSSLYAAGYETDGANYYRASIWQYNGISWDSLEVPEMRLGFSMVRIHPLTGDMYLAGYSNDASPGWRNYAYVKTQNGFQKLVESTALIDLATVGNKLFYNIDRKLYYYEGGKLQLWKDFSSFFVYNQFFARSAKDIFSASPEGIIHYNGSDVQLVFKGNYNYGAAALFERDIFVIAVDDATGTNLIIHGALQDK